MCDEHHGCWRLPVPGHSVIETRRRLVYPLDPAVSGEVALSSQTAPVDVCDSVGVGELAGAGDRTRPGADIGSRGKFGNAVSRPILAARVSTAAGLHDQPPEQSRPCRPLPSAPRSPRWSPAGPAPRVRMTCCCGPWRTRRRRHGRARLRLRALPPGSTRHQRHAATRRLSSHYSFSRHLAEAPRLPRLRPQSRRRRRGQDRRPPSYAWRTASEW